MKFERPYFLESREQKKIEREQARSYLAHLKWEYRNHSSIVKHIMLEIESLEKGKNPRRMWPRIGDYLERKRRRGYHPITKESIFKDWKEKAYPILIDILKKNGSKLEGLEFYTNIPYSSISFSSGRLSHRVHVNSNGSYSLDIWDTYKESTEKEDGYNAKTLASKIFEGLEDLYHKEPLIRRRNQLIRRIEQKTGRNLKREIMNSTKNE